MLHYHDNKCKAGRTMACSLCSCCAGTCFTVFQRGDPKKCDPTINHLKVTTRTPLSHSNEFASHSVAKANLRAGVSSASSDPLPVKPLWGGPSVSCLVRCFWAQVLGADAGGAGIVSMVA